MKPICCKLECRKPADFRIEVENSDPEDYSEACMEHVGELLGDRKTGEGPWRVTIIPDGWRA